MSIYKEIGFYEIFSIFVEDSDYKYLNLKINNYLEHYDYLKSKSIYDSNILFNEDDKILIIQTCSNIKKGSFLIIVSKLIERVLL